MGDKSRIEWTEATWNPVRGCSLVSPGCTNCYAMKQAHRHAGEGRPYEGLTKLSKGGPVWTGEARFIPSMLDRPLRWKRPRRIFVNSMSDLFHEDIADEQIAAVFGVMAACPEHSFQLLTKRPERAVEWFRWYEGESGAGASSIAAIFKAIEEIGRGGRAPGLMHHAEPPWPLPNVWIGVSVEDQQRADERIPKLLEIPAAVRWLSCEPLLGALEIASWLEVWGVSDETGRTECSQIDWVVVGGESGPRARLMHPQWVRDIRDQCGEAGVPFFFKQWGEFSNRQEPLDGDGYFELSRLATNESVAVGCAPGHGTVFKRVGKASAGRELDGRTWDEYPRLRDA